jgi:hypothetical protein
LAAFFADFAILFFVYELVKKLNAIKIC